MAAPSPNPRLSGTLATTLAAATVSALPVLLLGGLAVLVRGDLGFGEFGLGLAIGSFFAASAAVSLPAGALSDRLGPQRTIAVGLAGTIVTMAGIAALPGSLPSLLPWLLAAGAANALIQVGANHLMAVAVPAHRQGVAFGIKQSAIPLAAVLAGISVPAVGLTVGWRAAYGIAAAIGVAVTWVLWRGARSEPQPERPTARHGDAPIPALVVLALGAGLGTTASNALAGFSVSSLVAGGIPQDAAGLLLTAGSLLGMATRIAGGWLADRWSRGSLLLVIGLLVTGSVGFAVLAVAPANVPLVVAATLVAFVGAWGYSGLVLLAVARTNPAAPAVALAIVRMGPNSGAVVGPLVFGAIVEGAGYSAAWAAAACAALVAAALVLAGRVLLLPVRRRIVAARDGDAASR